MPKANQKTISDSSIADFVGKEGCFDLQFRRDVRHKRTGSPVYYSWKAQFVLPAKVDKEDLIKAIADTLDCGRIHYITGSYLRYSVQDIDSLNNIVIPFFKTNALKGKKKHDFELWARAIRILYQNKGKSLPQWQKADFQALLTLLSAMQKYKAKRPGSGKWISIAQAVIEHLE